MILHRLILPLALLPLATAAAAVERAGRTAATDYVLARAADAGGDFRRAAAGYASALAAAPGDGTLALRGLRQSLYAGDRAAAVAAARTLESAGALPPDGRLLLIGEAVARRDWRAADTALAATPGADPFAFLSPVIAAWIDRGQGRDALAALAPPAGGTIVLPYLAEHRALLLLSDRARRAEGVAAMRALVEGGGARAVRLRLAAAAILAPDDRAAALDLLTGPDPALVRGRAIVAGGGALPAAIDTPAAGLAELFVRVAADLNRERITPMALSLARIATFLAPDSAEPWLVTTGLLAVSGRTDAALEAAGHVAPGDPFAATVRDTRLRLLLRAGRSAEALAEAEAATRAPGAGHAEWTRLGDLLMTGKEPARAAAAYAAALPLAERDPEARGALAPLWLQRGAALDEAGDWARARPALEQALALAPDDPTMLNYLGYALIEKNERLPQATAMLEKASRLAPEDAAITDSLGWAYFTTGRPADALPLLERAAAAEPGDPAINDHLGDAYWAAGRRFEARYAWRAAQVYAEPADRARIATKLIDGPARR